MAKRRGNHEGAIYQKKNGRWQAQVILDRTRISKSFPTRKECVFWINEIVLQKEKGLTSITLTISFEDFANKWLQIVKTRIRIRTWQQYKTITDSHLIPAFGNLRLSEVKPAAIQFLYSKKLVEGTGTRTVQLIHAVLRNMMGFAEKQGMVTTNPTKRVEKPTVEKKELTLLSENEVQKLLVGAANRPIGMLLNLAVITGMRQGELLGLKWTDIDWDKATVKVQRQLQRIPGLGQTFSPPKSKNGFRTIQLGSATLSKLKKHKATQQIQLAEFGNKENLIFPSTVGKPKESRILGREFRELLTRLGLPKIRFHDLRHTAASLMLSNGMELMRIARQLGHSRPSITLDVYGHLIPGLENGAAQRLDDLINRPTAADLQQ